MILILLGPPGSGKGTQTALLAAALGIPAISTGDLFRVAVAAGSALGREVKPLIDAGRLVPDDLTLRILKERISRPDCRKGFILDGFPRTLPQAEALAALARIDLVINLAVPEHELLERLGGRLTCARCNAIYNARTAPPKRAGVCDRCGAPVSQRADETPHAIRERLRAYREKTAPLISYYRAKALLTDVDGEGSPDAIHQRLLAALKA